MYYFVGVLCSNSYPAAGSATLFRRASTLAPPEPKTQVLAYRALSPFAVLTFGFEGTSQRAGPTASVRACEEQVQGARDTCGAGYALRCVRHHQAMTRRGNGGQVGSTTFLRAQKLRDYVHG